MRRSLQTIMVVTASILLSGIRSFAQTPIRDLRPDVDFLLHAIDSIHPGPYEHIVRDSLRAAAARLRERLPRMTEPESVAGFAQLVAMLQDGHSRLGHVQLASHGPPHLAPLPIVGFDRVYPVRFEFFSDGLYVIGADTSRAELLGGHVVRIQQRPATDAGTRLQPFISYDNVQWLYHMLPVYLRHPGYLFAAGVTSHPSDSLRIEVETVGGMVSATLAPVHPDSIAWNDLRPVAETVEPNYWLRPLSDSVLYVRFRQVQDDAALSIADFASRLTATMDSMRLRNLVIDMRGNGGGNGYLNQPLIHALIRQQALHQPGALRVLIDRGTFSAAIMFASAVELNLFTAFVGEPTGSPANQFGDPARVMLPNSTLLVRISSLYWQPWDPRDQRPAILPDTLVVPSFDDWLHGRDPVLVAALGPLARIQWPAQPNMNWERQAENPAKFRPGVRW